MNDMRVAQIRDLVKEMSTSEGVERIKAELAVRFAEAERMVAAIEESQETQSRISSKGNHDMSAPTKCDKCGAFGTVAISVPCAMQCGGTMHYHPVEARELLGAMDRFDAAHSAGRVGEAIRTGARIQELRAALAARLSRSEEPHDDQH